ncbi:MAG: AAA family ATPase [Bacteroidetes bacterium]|nr:AAA family ATPase [Bacteroidota bacterium]
MKIIIENLGVLKKVAFELGDLTLICGHNNTGKTYATYALFGFLLNGQRFMRAEVSNQEIDELVNDGATRINLTRHAKKAKNILSRGCRRYTRQLPRIFASNSKYFKETQFQVELELDLESILSPAFERRIRSRKSELLSLSKAEGSSSLVVSLSADAEKIEFPTGIIKEAISGIINEIIFGRYFPNPFIVSAERTGVAIFSKELDFARNRLLEEMARTDKDIDPMELLLKSYNDYALPVKVNVEFTRRVADIIKEDSFIVEEHAQILDEFTDIIGGEYIPGNNNLIYFKPSGKLLRLTMGESSGVVRSMLDIGSYLRHIAKPGDLLMVDEPELGLHPENQRRVARLFARLINLGIRVFITTHSDYIIKELNTLIMLNQDKPYLKRIAEREGYRSEEFVDAKRVKVYVAEKALMKTRSSNKRRSRHQTFKEAKVSQEQGIDARSFDETINKMNEIQEAIVWGSGE